MGPVLEKTREDSGKLEVICLWQERAAMLSIRDTAVIAWFDSRMCPATLLGNSSIAQELGCWMK